MFAEAVSEIEQALKHGRLNSSAKDVEFREKLYAQELALYSILEKLRTFMESGVLAEEEIKRRTVAERLKDFIT